MRKLLNKPWVVGPLACIAIGLVAYEGLGLARADASAVPAETVEAENSDALADVPRLVATADALAGAEMLLTPGIRDPFAPRATTATAPEKPAAAAATGLETVKLTAVWLQNGKSFVAVNERICQVGDVIDGAAIESVSREGAWLRLPSGRHFVPVGREISFVGPQKSAASSPLIVTREY